MTLLCLRCIQIMSIKYAQPFHIHTMIVNDMLKLCSLGIKKKQNRFFWECENLTFFLRLKSKFVIGRNLFLFGKGK